MAELSKWELAERDVERRIRRIAGRMCRGAQGIYRGTWGYSLPPRDSGGVFGWNVLRRATETELDTFNQRCEAAQRRVDHKYQIEEAANEV